MSPERNRHRSCLPRLAALLALAASAPAQILAHPGWTRSGFAAEPWYQRAVFYQVPDVGCPTSRRDVGSRCETDFKALADRFDAMQSVGIDAVIVSPPALPSLSGASADAAITAQAAFDSRLNDVDNFTRQGTARGIRILVALPAAHADADLAGRARFWLTRGVAGLRLEIPPDTGPQDRAAIAASVRSVAASIATQRIVLVDGDTAAPTADAGAPHRTATRRATPAAAAPQLQVATLAGPLTAASLRPQLSLALTSPSTLLDAHASTGVSNPGSFAYILATLALATSSAALADPAEPLVLPATLPAPEPEDDAKPAAAPIPPQPPPGVYLPYVPYVPPARPVKKVAPPPPPPPADPLTIFYAKLAALRHSNQALRTGTKMALDFDAENVLVWVAKPVSPTPQNPPVVVLCNLSAQPVQISLADAMKKLNLHGFFLRTLLRSDDAMGAEDLEAVKLAPYGLFIGELRR